ncbi:hypothetical protein CANARDRAFT_10252 [[Candida] arabinofermentans NRRL YB-2248]|uniref:Peptidase A1 domain-containing protein n=1 Tax=[Candida] arabinofermentans NRRL YB-2248 TaxID=983967 RepID=A0A1E4ST90_9ASCO|nr:hypothetical protein CANARDRAFT_10252 [[Candida] arabinofermentans NRRL YB-2248]
MHFNSLLTITAYLSSLALASEEPSRVISYLSDIRYKDTSLIHELNSKRKFMKREDVSVASDFHQTLITFPLYLGTEGQKLTTVADTGSFKLWVLDEASFGSSEQLCEDGSCFTTSESSTFAETTEAFSVTYNSDFGASGKWATDKLSLDGTESTTFKFGLATSYYGNNGGYSFAGLGYTEDYEGDNTLILEAMVKGGLVDKKIVSFAYEQDNLNWGDDIMTTGTITFGGASNTTSDDLKYFDIISKTDISIGFKSVSHGSTVVDCDSTSKGKIVVDTGTTSFSAKQKYYDALFSEITFDTDNPSFFSCSTYADYEIKIALDDDSTISVPLMDISWNYYQDDYDLCQPMISTLNDDDDAEMIFSQYFLKSLLTVIDIDSMQVGFAPRSSGSSWA